MMVGRLLSFWEGLFSGAMLNFRWIIWWHTAIETGPRPYGSIILLLNADGSRVSRIHAPNTASYFTWPKGSPSQIETPTHQVMLSFWHRNASTVIKMVGLRRVQGLPWFTHSMRWTKYMTWQELWKGFRHVKDGSLLCPNWVDHMTSLWTLCEHNFISVQDEWIGSNSSGLELEVQRSPVATISVALCTLDVGAGISNPLRYSTWNSNTDLYKQNGNILWKGNLSIPNTNQLKPWPSFLL